MMRAQVNQTLRMMEQIRELSYEAENAREERRMTKQYNDMWKSIEPYVSGRIPYSDARPIIAPQ